VALPKPPTAQQIQRAAQANYIGGPGGGVTGLVTPKPPKLPSTYKPPPAPVIGPDYAASHIYPTSDIASVMSKTPQAPGGPPVFNMPDYQEPDWNSLINANFYTQEAESQAGPQRAQADINLKSGIANALYNYGWDPSTMGLAGWGTAAPYIDQAAIDAASGNQYSALATTARQQAAAQAQSDAALAGRGMLSSGQQATNTGNIQTAAGEARQNAYSTLMGAVQTGINRRADVESQIAQALSDARAKAAAFVSQNYQAPSIQYMGDYIQQLIDYYNQPQNPAVTSVPTVTPRAPVAPVAPKKAPVTYIGGPGGMSKGTTTGRIVKR